jgi:hypothetical protein
MIAADLELLNFQKRKDFTLILEKELDYINRDLINMSGTAALLAGFSFSGLNTGPVWCQWSWGDAIIEHYTGHFAHGPFLENIFAMACTWALVVNLLLVAKTTSLAMFGPFHALHVTNEAFLEQSVKTLREVRSCYFPYALLHA